MCVCVCMRACVGVCVCVWACVRRLPMCGLDMALGYIISVCVSCVCLPLVEPPLFRRCHGGLLFEEGRSLFCPKLWHVGEDYCPLCASVCVYACVCRNHPPHNPPTKKKSRKKAREAPAAKAKLIPQCLRVDTQN